MDIDTTGCRLFAALLDNTLGVTAHEQIRLIYSDWLEEQGDTACYWFRQPWPVSYDQLLWYGNDAGGPNWGDGDGYGYGYGHSNGFGDGYCYTSGDGSGRGYGNGEGHGRGGGCPGHQPFTLPPTHLLGRDNDDGTTLTCCCLGQSA